MKEVEGLVLIYPRVFEFEWFQQSLIPETQPFYGRFCPPIVERVSWVDKWNFVY